MGQKEHVGIDKLNKLIYYLFVSDLRYPVWTEDFFMKKFKTIDEQITILKRKNIVFDNELEARAVLLNNNYYNIINGYKDLFLNPSKKTFKSKTKFEEIYALYDFDRQIRGIFLEYILKIENILRSLIAYHFSQSYGFDNYLKLDSFETYHDVEITNVKKKKQIKFIQLLIGNINKKIAAGIDISYVTHYMTKYGFIPLWVLVNILSFGEICNFYKLMKQRERIKVAKEFNISETEMCSLLGILAKTRNLCAHGERLYNYKFNTNVTINDTIYHKYINIPRTNNRYDYGKNDLFAVIIALKILLNSDDYSKFHHKLYSRLMSLKSKLNTISLTNVLDAMSFPNNWHDILKCPKSTRDT